MSYHPRSNVPSTTRLSVVVPLFNEEESVELLYRTIVAALESFSGRYEIVFVDDGSSDKTFDARGGARGERSSPARDQVSLAILAKHPRWQPASIMRSVT